ncbi:MAG: hypothetical protein IIV64_07330 [Muribaculaceae bacterium]|nr:hypothetical protein [Muribaculaceae bacterium]
MFERKEIKNIYLDKKAAREIAKSNIKASKEAARIQAGAESDVAYYERMASKEAEEMRLLRENPEAYRMMKEIERQEKNQNLKHAAIFMGIMFFLGIICYLILIS